MSKKFNNGIYHAPEAKNEKNAQIAKI